METLSLCLEEEIDLEQLINSPSDDDDSDRHSEGFNNSGASDESTTSLDTQMTSHCVNGNGKPTTNGKSFIKSLPMAILSRKKYFGSHSDLSHQRAASPVMPIQLSSSIPQVGSKAFKHGKQMNWSVWITDLNHYEDVELPNDATCNLLLQEVLGRLGRSADVTIWSIVVQNSEYLIERIVEDHEVLVDLKESFPVESIIKLCLNRTPTKFDILQNPETSLPPGMLTLPPTHAPPTMESIDSKRIRLQAILTKTAPEFSGWLHVIEPRGRFWKKNFCVLRNSGLYYSTKGDSKEPRHLHFFADVLSSNVWLSMQNKKYSPSHCFCLKGKNSHETTYLSTESLFEKRAWVNAIRLIMNGNRFYESYVNARRRRGNTVLTRFRNSHPQYSSSESNLVAMDFSGNQGRVISDPNEVAMIELEQQSTWRKKLIRSHGPSGTFHQECHGSAPTQGSAWIARTIHQTQGWYFGKISREDAAEVLQRQGMIEGSYLVRESRRIPGGFVISLCHNQKIRNVPISQMDIDGQWCFSIDGETRFLDLIQLIDFHRLNRGSLPCRLQHEALSAFT